VPSELIEARLLRRRNEWDSHALIRLSERMNTVATSSERASVGWPVLSPFLDCFMHHISDASSQLEIPAMETID
jgi:hypothetical protein